LTPFGKGLQATFLSFHLYMSEEIMIGSAIKAITHPGTKPELLGLVKEGLDSGNLYQTGGVIRRALPPGSRGQIFAHVYQHGLASSQGLVDWGAQAAKSLQVVQGLAMVNTALSVVNLGVSIAGFAILAKKLSSLERSVQALETTVRDGFAGIESRLDTIAMKLNGLAFLVHAGTVRIETQLEGIARQIDWSQLARLRASMESLADIEAGRKAGRSPGDHAEQVREVRSYLQGTLGEIPFAASAGIDFALLRARLLVLALAQAVVAEANAWRLADETAVAARVLEENGPAVAKLAKKVSEALLGGDVAVLGEPGIRPTLQASRVETALPAFLLERAWAPPAELSRQLTSQWTEYVAADPKRSRAMLRQPATLRQRVAGARELAFPLAEASLAIEGLEHEYTELARANVARSNWELDQVYDGPPALVIRASLNAHA
jgi:hypothetical protein